MSSWAHPLSFFSSIDLAVDLIVSSPWTPVWTKLLSELHWQAEHDWQAIVSMAWPIPLFHREARALTKLSTMLTGIQKIIWINYSLEVSFSIWGPLWICRVFIRLKRTRKWSVCDKGMACTDHTFRSSCIWSEQNYKSDICPAWYLGPEIAWVRPMGVMVAMNFWVVPPSETLGYILESPRTSSLGNFNTTSEIFLDIFVRETDRQQGSWYTDKKPTLSWFLDKEMMKIFKVRQLLEGIW